LASFFYQTFQKEEEETFVPSFDVTMSPTAIPDSNSVTKDSQMVETGGVYTSDETELVRMGYKQELKCVQFNFMRHLLPKFMILARYQA